MDGILHTVEAGDSLASVAQMYEVDERDIVEFVGNGLDGVTDALEVGSLILIPGATRHPLGSGPPPGGVGWTWPVVGDLMTSFGPDHPVGIDLRAPLGTEVVAARGGEVTYAGGDPCCDNGYYVIVEHSDGFETLYAHLDELRTVPGASVDAGEVIGTVGATGEAEEPHLHFEIRRVGIYQDPLDFLP